MLILFSITIIGSVAYCLIDKNWTKIFSLEDTNGFYKATMVIRIILELLVELLVLRYFIYFVSKKYKL